MITVTTVSDTEGKILRFKAEGHSGFADSGSDIVCAAVSSTLWMIINGIEKQNLAQLSYEERDGFVDCTVSAQRQDGADVLLSSFVMFIEELSEQYGDFLKLVQK